MEANEWSIVKTSPLCFCYFGRQADKESAFMCLRSTPKLIQLPSESPEANKNALWYIFGAKQASLHLQTTSLIAEDLLYSFCVATHQSRRAGVHMILQGSLHAMIALRCGFWGIINNEQPCAHSHNFYTTIIILCSFHAIRSGAPVAFILSAFTFSLSQKKKEKYP